MPCCYIQTIFIVGCSKEDFQYNIKTKNWLNKKSSTGVTQQGTVRQTGLTFSGLQRSGEPT